MNRSAIFTKYTTAFSARSVLTTLFVSAIAVRAVYLIQAADTPLRHGLSMDSSLFDALAMRIVNGDWGYKDSIFLNEFYQFFLAAVYAVAGLDQTVVLGLQALLDAASSLLVCYIAWQTFNRTVGIAAGFLYAFYGIAIFYSGLVLDTTVSIFLELSFISLLIFGSERRHPIGYFAAAGLAFGLLLLARPNVVLFFPLLPVYGIFLARSRFTARRTAGLLAVFSIAAGIMLAASAVRHYHYFSSASPFAAHGGFNFYIGNNPAAEGIFMSPSGVSSNPASQIKTSIRLASMETGKPLSPYEASRFWLRKGLSYLASHPFDAATLYAKKTLLFIRKEEISLNIDYPLSRRLVPLFNLPFISYGLVSPLAFIGVFLALRAMDDKKALVLSFYLACSGSIILFFISDRYRLPAEPFTIMLAAWAGWRVATAVNHGRKTAAGALAALAAFFLLVNYDFKALDQGNPAGTHFNNLAMVYIRSGDSEKATAYLSKAIETDPAAAAPYNNLGQLHVERGDIPLGIQNLQKALAIDPRYAVAHYNMGKALDLLGRKEDARRHYETALDISPNLAEARVNLAHLLMEDGDLAAARRQFAAAIEEDDGLLPAYEGLGKLQASTGDLTAAAATFRRVLDMDADNYTALVNLGLALSKQDPSSEEAIDWFRKAIRQNPEGAEAYLHLGTAEARRGNHDQAMAHYEKSIALNPDYYEARIRIGIAQAMAGDLDRATAQFQKAVEIQPEGAEARLNLIKAYLVSGNPSAAAEAYTALSAINPAAASSVAHLMKNSR
ncbi:MAG: tetratricopeptide repeat protein [Pseudomonadota bacterium]